MSSKKDWILPNTKETHFTDPDKIEQTTYTIERYTHKVPLDWFLVNQSVIYINSYEKYLKSEGSIDERDADYNIKSVEFDYERERNTDGTGKPFHIILLDSDGNESKYHPRTHSLLQLLDYEKDTYEIVAMAPTDEGDGVLVTIQERLPHIPKKDRS